MASAQEVDVEQMKSMTVVELPAGKLKPGNSILGVETGPGGVQRGTVPHRDLAHQEFPRIVYKHPKRGWKRMNLPVDGHGNKEWQWVANEAETRKVANPEELEKAKKEGFQLKHYVTPPRPIEDAEEEPEEAK
jgi:hypothetical protein